MASKLKLRKNHRLLRKIGKIKYYLIYTMLPILHMKWENCEINVVEQANIPKFGKLDA